MKASVHDEEAKEAAKISTKITQVKRLFQF